MLGSSSSRRNSNQSRPSPRQKRHPRNLPVKFLSPSPRNRLTTSRARARCRQLILLHPESPPPNQSLSTLRTPCILQPAHVSRQVPAIHIPQPSRAPNSCRPHQILRPRVLPRSHLIVPMKRRYMPRYIHRHARHKLRQPPQLVVRVIESPDQQRNNLHPNAHAIERANRLQNRLNPPAQLPVMPVVK